MKLYYVRNLSSEVITLRDNYQVVLSLQPAGQADDREPVSILAMSRSDFQSYWAAGFLAVYADPAYTVAITRSSDLSEALSDGDIDERILSVGNARYVPQSTVNSTLPIAIFGSSLTRGENGLSAGQEWANVLATRLGVTVQNYGQNGATVDMILTNQAAQADKYGQIQIIEMGANDIPLLETGAKSVSTILAGYGAAVGRLSPVRPRFIVWGPLDRGASEGASTQRGKWTREIEARLEATYGPAFINVRKYMSERGLADAGITPTAQDTTDMAAGAIPQSLRFAGSIHMNAAGHAVQGKLFERALRDRAWFTIPATQYDTYDSIVTRGSLLLVEPGHPAYGWSGVPTGGTLLPNLAAESAKSILGSSVEVRPTWFKGAAQAASNSIFERSTKGGLHGIVSQTTGGMGATSVNASGKGAGVAIPADIIAYLKANPANSYYISLWSNITRISGETTAGLMPFLDYIGNKVDPSSAYLQYHASGLRRPLAVPPLIAAREPGTPDTLGPSIRTAGVTGFTGTMANVDAGYAAQWGVPDATTRNHLKTPSFVFYRYVLEDLTVSGRTYAAADAADFAAYTAAVTTSGGRYYGDTFTDPATLA